MRQITIIALLAMLGLAGGCAQLNTRVYVFDMEGYKAYGKMKESYAALQEIKSTLDETPEEQRDKAKYEATKKALARTGAYLYGIETDAWWTDMAGLFARRTVVAEAAAARENVKAISEGDSKLTSLKATADVRKSGSEPETKLATLEAASQYVYAPRRFWKRQINEASAYGGYGNVDIAIRMQEGPDFSLKSMRVDSSELVANTVALTKQVVSVVAAIYGVPTSLSNGGSSASAFSTASDLGDMAEATAAWDADRIARETAQEELLLTMKKFASDLNANADPEKFGVAIKSVQQAFASQKDTLSE